jgi:ArsR family transcriptional regulator
MELVQIYQCLCEATRLRIIHLLTHGPLCVCHFQQLLDVPQVKVSQQLSYLRKHGMVESRRHANWMIYSLPADRTPELDANLRCLQDCAQTDVRFRTDLQRLKQMKKESLWVSEALGSKCCESASTQPELQAQSRPHRRL